MATDQADERECPACDGSGEGTADWARCWTCRGRGVLDSRASDREEWLAEKGDRERDERKHERTW
jgi:DnaJ-class molecular chaperone